MAPERQFIYPPTPLNTAGFLDFAAGFRRIEGVDPGKLRLFFLSLLWRGAATNRVEFAEITLPDLDLECLRQMLVTGDPGPVNYYPIFLVQLSTLGKHQNLAPFSDTIYLFDETMNHFYVPRFRFYFDGLIAWILRPPSDSPGKYQNEAVVGYGRTLLVSTVPYERSFQLENAEKHLRETIGQFPQQFLKLMGLKMGGP